MNEDIIEKPLYTDKDVTPRDLLKFARQILGGLAILFVFGCFAEWMLPYHGIIDLCKTVLPSIATLVIGYYFGKTN